LDQCINLAFLAILPSIPPKTAKTHSKEKKRKNFTVFGRGRIALEKIKGLQTESLS